MDKLGQEPAFSTSALLSGGEDIYEAGITKRFYAATQILAGFASQGHTGGAPHKVSIAYKWADELLKQEND